MWSAWGHQHLPRQSLPALTEGAMLLAMRIECPICQKVIEDAPDDFAPRPFCSPRCKLLDLDNWLSERYRVSEPLRPEDTENEQRDLN
jgi:hypothetical protein